MRTLPPLLLLCAVAACGGGDDDAGGPDAGDAPDADPGVARIGSVRVIEQRSVFDDGSGTPTTYRSSSTQASFYVGGPPRFHQEAMREGACVLETYTPSLCTPGCTDGLCVDNVCEPWGTLASAGRLTVTGTTTTVTIDPKSGYYYNQDVLPENLFADDATITATLAGDQVAGATLTAGGVRAIATAFEDGELDLPYPAGEDFAVAWTPAGDDSRVRVTFNANNQGHGMPYLAIITCDVADSAGEVLVPEAMLDAFPESQAWSICAGTDCPRSTITRYRRDTVPVGDDQELELVVGSQFDFGINHAVP